MARDPAFLFYPADWISGTMYFTHLQKGAYFDLLMLQFNAGRFNEEQAKQVLNGCFDSVWTTVKLKFKSDGVVFWNERLEVEKEKRSSYCKSRRDNKVTSLHASYDTTYDKTYETHMVNRNIIDNNISLTTPAPIVKSKFVPPTIEQVREYFAEKYYSENIADAMWEHYNSKDWINNEGKPVLNWKLTACNVWFRPEHKVEPPSSEELKKIEHVKKVKKKYFKDGTYSYKGVTTTDFDLFRKNLYMKNIDLYFNLA